ncbi:hypothetical protein [Stutzerimonas nitrititolerans]|uniref:hypothetical protein n=1 Tax=Stutzerimonas nitrititolerans TaxID=2482751 RepID=UPI001BDD32D6|nr:hypothetical protein [Stutzerimonas nitrititolerans]MBT1120725.1 hypothetical protein [Stutzerimonas nitrititolerans]
MNNHGKLKKYSDLFRKYMREYLAPGIHVSVVIHPVSGPGAVFEFILGRTKLNDKIKPEKPTVGHVLNSIDQGFVRGNVDGIRFRGTNIMLSQNKILIVKGEDGETAWAAQGVREDLLRVVSTSQGGAASERA